jgi:hypothetical protein
MIRKAYSRMTLGLATVLTIALSLPSNVWAASWKEKVLYSFQGGMNDGSGPAGGVVFDQQGNLYGATTGGGPDNCFPIGNECGLVYELSPPAKQGDPWTETILYRFKGKGANDASVPLGGLIFDNAGNLYGATVYGGTGDCVLLGTRAGCGTVFELSPPAKQGDPWTETILYSFKGGKDGYAPQGSLVFDGAGNLYGSTWFGGGYGGSSCNPYFQYWGTIFKVSPPKQKGGAWTEKVLYSFKNGKDAAQPNGGLTFDKQGALYGATFCGGASPCTGGAGSGVVFVLKPPAKQGGRWQFGLAYTFNGSDGGVPSGGLIFDAKGNIYGAALSGGKYQFGVAFKLIPPMRQGRQWKEIVLHNFTAGADGGNRWQEWCLISGGHCMARPSAVQNMEVWCLGCSLPRAWLGVSPFFTISREVLTVGVRRRFSSRMLCEASIARLRGAALGSHVRAVAVPYSRSHRKRSFHRSGTNRKPASSDPL